MTHNDAQPSLPKNPSSIQVIDGSILGSKIASIAKKMQDGVGRPDSGGPSHEVLDVRKNQFGHSAAVGGLRTYIPERLGVGYWDFIEICPGALLSVTDAQYNQEHTMTLPAEDIVKIRIITSGTLIWESHNKQLADGSIVIQRLGNVPTLKYVIKPTDSPLRMVVLHAVPEVLINLGVTSEMLPTEVRSFFDVDSIGDAALELTSSSTIMRISNDIIESRNRLIGDLRQSYLRGKAYELLCEVILRAGPIRVGQRGGNRIRQSDIVRLHEAKRILVCNLESSPTINELSKLVGINRTKLKAGFREIFGETVHQYRTRVRLAEALRLIEETDCPMGEISRRVGFAHPANFTQAIRRRFGVRPLDLRRRGRISSLT